MTRKRKDDQGKNPDGFSFTFGGWHLSIGAETSRALMKGVVAVVTVAVNGLIFLAICLTLGLGFLVADARFDILRNRPAEQGSSSDE